MTPATEQRHAVFQRDAHAGCLATLTVPGHVCAGRFECAHALPKSWIRNHQLNVRGNQRRGHPLFSADIETVIFDPDCAFMLCATGRPGGHFRWDNFAERCTYEQLPAHVHSWASKWGLGGRLLDYYAAAEAAA